MKTLFHLYAINRDGFRVTPKETATDRARAERLLRVRNSVSSGQNACSESGVGRQWVAVEVERSSGRHLASLGLSRN